MSVFGVVFGEESPIHLAAVYDLHKYLWKNKSKCKWKWQSKCIWGASHRMPY